MDGREEGEAGQGLTENGERTIFWRGRGGRSD